MHRLGIAWIALAIPFALADSAFAGKKKSAEVYLVRPTSPPDADAQGSIKLETEANKDKDKIEFKAEHLDPLGSYHVFIEDGVASGQFVDAGAMSLDDALTGEFDLKFDEKQGPLPQAVASVVDLAGRVVNIEDGMSAIVLSGTIPDPTQPGPGGNGNGWKKKKANLGQPMVVVDSNAKGRVEVWFKGKDDRQRFRVHAEHLDPVGTFSVFVEDSVGAGTFTLAGAMVADGPSGEFKLFLDNKKGDAMPLGVANVDDLAGRVVQIQDATTAVVLVGTIPDLLP